ncbi:MAG: DNA recombination protein RmuC [Vulcanimicrobiaceae bacterium]
MTANPVAIAIIALCIGFAIGALVLRVLSQSQIVRTQERLTAAVSRADEAQQRVLREEQLRSDAERTASAALAQAAGLQATLAETSEKQQHAIEALLERTKTELRETTASRASERVGELVAPITQKLTEFDAFVREIESKRNADTGGLKEQIASLLSRAEKLELTTAQLSSHTSTLVTALRNPATRGKWGEIQLRNVVEKAGMLSYCDFEEQQQVVLETGSLRPDMTINLPGNRRVFVDAKTPIDSLQAAFEESDEATRRALTRQQARALAEHVDALSKRNYHTAEGSADFVILFIPGEAFLSAALNENPALIEYALDKGVLIAGPLSLISLLRSFAMGWQAVKQEENAKRIAVIGRELYERTTRFAERLVNIGKNLERTVGAFNESVATYEGRLLPQGRKLKEDAAFATDDLPDIATIDVAPRNITAIDARTQTMGE